MTSKEKTHSTAAWYCSSLYELTFVCTFISNCLIVQLSIFFCNLSNSSTLHGNKAFRSLFVNSLSSVSALNVSSFEQSGGHVTISFSTFSMPTCTNTHTGGQRSKKGGTFSAQPKSVHYSLIGLAEPPTHNCSSWADLTFRTIKCYIPFTCFILKGTVHSKI